jgi:hypothetical protein
LADALKLFGLHTTRGNKAGQDQADWNRRDEVGEYRQRWPNEHDAELVAWGAAESLQIRPVDDVSANFHQDAGQGGVRDLLGDGA